MDVNKALKMIQPFMDRGASLCIGGGEPTLEEVENDVEEKLECPVYGHKVREALA